MPFWKNWWKGSFSSIRRMLSACRNSQIRHYRLFHRRHISTGGGIHFCHPFPIELPQRRHLSSVYFRKIQRSWFSDSLKHPQDALLRMTDGLDWCVINRIAFDCSLNKTADGAAYCSSVCGFVCFYAYYSPVFPALLFCRTKDGDFFRRGHMSAHIRLPVTAVISWL